MTTSARTATWVGLLLLAASSIPMAIGYVIAPADRQFMGIVSDVPDWAEYLAWMKAFSVRAVIENPLTCEPQTPAFFNLQWLLLGRLAAWMPTAIMLEAFRLIAGGGFLVLTWRTASAYFGRDGGATWLAWWLINGTAGFGWIWVVDKYLFARSDARYPLDLYVAEPVTFQNMIIFPHFLVAAGLLLLTFSAAAAAIKSNRWGPALASGASALVLALTHAYDLIIVYAVLGVFLLTLLIQQGWSWFRVAAMALIVTLSVGPPAYFAYLTSTDPIWRMVLAQYGDAGVFTPSPPHLLVLMGLPLVFILASIGNLRAWDQPDPWRLLVRVWCVVNAILLYIPSDFQVHMLSGWQIPLGLLASEGFCTRIWPRIRTIVSRAVLPSTPRRGQVVGALLLLALTVPTNLYLLTWRIREVRRLDHDHFLYRDEIDALGWLGQHGGDGDVVLASVTVGQFVPGLSGNRPYAAHWAQTVAFNSRRAEIAAFFRDETSAAERTRILRQCRVRYVLHGRAERALGGFDPATMPTLTPVLSAGETRLYRVDSLGSGDPA